ncbi:unnamed protein product [Rotaria magnacalcarata]|uniref:Aminotransferase class V domain-containing protein n=1 Tax=Rotaria magnacalcarata TaxID=392030 RepID=A0A816Q1Y4_9BILA|nr:unnamed protein product [Rotaria magnacalcarata]CAF4074314.1 unnamed protein product [Rotaria magnacalcarata]CAF4182636.1 unnamed protein product [Rotaria magnacalcarata]
MAVHSNNDYIDLSEIIYLDNNATTCEDKLVIESMINHLRSLNLYGNPSSSHLFVDSNRIIDLEHFRQVLKPETKLLTIMHSNNEIGSIQPIEEIINLPRKYGSSDIIIHSDASQSIGKVLIDVQSIGIDLLTICLITV